MKMYKPSTLVLSGLATCLLGGLGYLSFEYGDFSQGKPGVKILHMPAQYVARSGHLTVNITGEITGARRDKKTAIQYQLNDGDWITIPQDELRAPPPNFTIELHPQQLKQGKNCLSFSTDEVELPPRDDAVTDNSSEKQNAGCFDYGVQTQYDWTRGALEVQDGHWEKVSRDGIDLLRPAIGYEGYDKIVLLSEPFSGSRRITARMKFIERQGKYKPYGFGILALWGGHPDEMDVFPRRGWAYGLAWYYSLAKGVGAEIATKYADQPFFQTRSYRSYDVTNNAFYHVIVEAIAATPANENYQLRMKWWAEGDEQPEGWLHIDEAAGKRLPNQAYAVAALAHRAQVEFYDIDITRLDAPQ